MQANNGRKEKDEEASFEGWLVHRECHACPETNGGYDKLGSWRLRKVELLEHSQE
jgi:hypothetical protein